MSRQRKKNYTNTLFPEFFKNLQVKKEKRHNDFFNTQWLDGMELEKKFNMPIISPYCEKIPDVAIPFHEGRALYNKGVHPNVCLHFYEDDSYFWNAVHSMSKYLSMLIRFPNVIGPDISMKMDMPYSLKMYVSYLIKLSTRYMQIHDVKTIPNIVWAGPDCYDFCFAGYPINSIVAVNSKGIKNNAESVFFWKKGYEEMMKRLSPKKILRIGEKIKGEDESISVYYSCDHINRLRNGR